jgi:hypothetical protein
VERALISACDDGSQRRAGQRCSAEQQAPRSGTYYRGSSNETLSTERLVKPADRSFRVKSDAVEDTPKDPNPAEK